MSRGLFAAGAGAFAIVLAIGTTAQAQETGLAEALHDLRMEGGRLCMSDHFHYGSSNGGANRKSAETEAIRSWADFTAFEYGNAWADYRIAASKTMKCSGGAGTSWSCSVEARACKRAPVRKR